jgi:Fur family transcriptional regulator, ferric uptake regulator
MPDSSPFLSAVDRAGYRLTGPRRTVANLVAARASHFTAADLVSEAHRRRLGIGRATVFRTLELFTELGVVEHIDLPTGDHAYIACEPAHHHHVVCSSCGTTTEVDDSGVSAAVREIARRTGYAVDSHRLELYGLCPRCRRGRLPS